MSEVTRYQHIGTLVVHTAFMARLYPAATVYVLASDYDNLEQECERLRHSAANDLLDRLVTELLDSGAENYQESVFDLDLGSESLTASVMLRYRDKPYAHELRMFAESERDELRAQVEAMRANSDRYIKLRDIGGSSWADPKSGDRAQGSAYDALVDAL